MNALLAWYFVAVWGSGYVATKIGLQYAPPFTFLTLRFCFGLLCLAPIVALWKPKWPRSGAELGHIAVAGLLMHAVQLGASHYAQYSACRPASPHSSFHRSRFSRQSSPRAGCIRASRRAVGRRLHRLAGVALVVWHKIDVREVSAGSLVATIIALLGVTAATLYQRTFAPHTDLKAAAVIQFAATAAVLGPLALAVEGFAVRWSWPLLASIAFLVIFASFLAVSALHILMRHGEATRVTSMMYLPPIFAVVLEAALFHLLPSALTARRHRGDLHRRGDDRLDAQVTHAWKSPTSSC